MHRLLTRTYRMLFLLIVLLPSCINLKELNQFAANSIKNISKFEELGYGFGKACREKCLLGQLEKQSLIIDCVCKDEKTADSVMLVVYKATKGYFDGLHKLSGNDLVDFSFKSLSQPLKEGNFGGLIIN